MSEDQTLISQLFPNEYSMPIGEYEKYLTLIQNNIVDISPENIYRDDGEAVDISILQDGEITSAESKKLYNLRFNFKQLAIDLLPQIVSVGKIDTHHDAVLFIYQLLKIIGTNQSVTVSKKEAEVLLAIVMITNEKDIATNDIMIEYFGGNSETEILTILDKIEKLGCIKRRSNQITIVEEIRVKQLI